MATRANRRAAAEHDPVAGVLAASFLAASEEENRLWDALRDARAAMVRDLVESGLGESAARRWLSEIESKRRLQRDDPRIADVLRRLSERVPPARLGAYLAAARAFSEASERAFRAAMEIQDFGGQELRANAEKLTRMGDVRATLVATAARLNPTLDLKLVRELYGEGPELVASGAASADRMPVAGMFERHHNLATISLDGRFDPKENTYHEGFHSLEHVLTPAEQQTLRKAFPADGRMSAEERAAYAFAAWATRRERLETMGLGDAAPEVRRAFRKMQLFAGRHRQALLGRGFEKAEDIFEKAYTGELGVRAAQRAARWEKAGAARRRAASIGWPGRRNDPETGDTPFLAPKEEIAGDALRKKGRFAVLLDSRGNPDRGQDPDRPLDGVPQIEHPVASLAEASRAARDYIQSYGLGGGNWVGGRVTDLDAGRVVARVSYNGRVWRMPEEAATYSIRQSSDIEVPPERLDSVSPEPMRVVLSAKDKPNAERQEILVHSLREAQRAVGEYMDQYRLDAESWDGGVVLDSFRKPVAFVGADQRVREPATLQYSAALGTPALRIHPDAPEGDRMAVRAALAKEPPEALAARRAATDRELQGYANLRQGGAITGSVVARERRALRGGIAAIDAEIARRGLTRPQSRAAARGAER